ncbi:hypothetical protein TWF281_000207 [Arthrobotrys megalospora]
MVIVRMLVDGKVLELKIPVASVEAIRNEIKRNLSTHALIDASQIVLFDKRKKITQDCEISELRGEYVEARIDPGAKVRTTKTRQSHIQDYQGQAQYLVYGQPSRSNHPTMTPDPPQDPSASLAYFNYLTELGIPPDRVAAIVGGTARNHSRMEQEVEGRGMIVDGLAENYSFYRRKIVNGDSADFDEDLAWQG